MLSTRPVAIVTQLSMETGEPIIDMREYDDRSLTHRYSRCLGSRYLNSKLQIYYVLTLMVS